MCRDVGLILISKVSRLSYDSIKRSGSQTSVSFGVRVSRPSGPCTSTGTCYDCTWTIILLGLLHGYTSNDRRLRRAQQYEIQGVRLSASFADLV